MRLRSRVLVVLLCLLAAIAVGVCTPRVLADDVCDAPLTVLNTPESADTASIEAVDSYLASVYGADSRAHVLAFYSDYRDIHAVLGSFSSEALMQLSGFSLQRVRWNPTACRYDPDSSVKVRLAMASTRFEGAVMYGLIVHELSHLYGTPDGDGSVGDASWWESIGYHAYNETCGYLAGAALEHCQALVAAMGG